MEIITDHKWKDIKLGYELPKKWRKEHDWIKEDEFNNTPFAVYRGWAYPLSEFMRCEDHTGFEDWDGYAGDSFYSGTVIKLSEDGEQYMIGRYYS